MMDNARFEQAKFHYDRCIQFIDAMSANVKKKEPKFDGEIAKTQFDLILQYILLRTAIADGKFKAEEGEFIDSITKFYNAIYLVMDEKEQPSWQKLAKEKDLLEVKKIVNQIRDRAEKYINEFIFFFSVLDYVDKEYDLLAILKNEIDKLCEHFLFCDGKTEDDERFTAIVTVSEILAVPWKLKMAETEEIAKDREQK